MPKNKPTVLQTEPIHARFQKLLEKQARVIRPAGYSEDQLAEAARDAEGILIRTKGLVSAKIIAAAPRLKVVGRHGVGLDHIDIPAATKAGVWVVYTPAGSLDAVAEHTWTMILTLAKRAVIGNAAVRAGNFAARNQESLQLKGKMLGVLGLGRIGTRVAEIAVHGFGMRVQYTDLLRYPKKEKALGAKKVTLKRLLATSEVVTIHVPLDESTHGLLGARELAWMRRDGYLINCARGGVVDSLALAAALKAGTLAGAGLDVFEPEEPPLDHPLLQCANAILSPHNAAQTAEARFNYAQVIFDILRVLKGQKPQWPANAPAKR